MCRVSGRANHVQPGDCMAQGKKDQDLRGSFDCVVMSAAEDDTTLDALPAAYQQQGLGLLYSVGLIGASSLG